MTELLPDTWHHRELPVLREVVRLWDQSIGHAVKVSEVEAAVDIPPDDVQRAGIALARASLVDTSGAMQKRVLMFTNPSAEARRLVGQWPTAQSALDRIIASLEAIAANTGADDDDRTKAQRFAAWLKTGAGTVGISVATAAITGQLPSAGS